MYGAGNENRRVVLERCRPPAWTILNRVQLNSNGLPFGNYGSIFTDDL